MDLALKRHFSHPFRLPSLRTHAPCDPGRSAASSPGTQSSSRRPGLQDASRAPPQRASPPCFSVTEPIFRGDTHTDVLKSLAYVLLTVLCIKEKRRHVVNLYCMGMIGYQEVWSCVRHLQVTTQDGLRTARLPSPPLHDPLGTSLVHVGLTEAQRATHMKPKTY